MSTVSLPVALQQEVIAVNYHALPLCVILAQPSLEAWFRERFVNLCSGRYPAAAGRRALLIDYVERESAYDEVLVQTVVDPAIVDCTTDIIDLLCRGLRAGQYALIRCHEAVYTTKVETFATIRELLVYGFDAQARSFSVIGFNDVHRFVTFQLEGSRLEKAFLAALDELRQSERLPIIEHGQSVLRWMKLRDLPQPYPFSVQQWFKQLLDYRLSRGDARQHFFGNSWLLEAASYLHPTFGLSVTNQVIDALEALHEATLNSDRGTRGVTSKSAAQAVIDFDTHRGEEASALDIVLFKHIQTLFEHRKGIAKRFSYLINHAPGFQRWTPLIAEQERVVDQYNRIRLQFMKFKQSLDLSSLDCCVTMMRQALDSETMTLDHILSVFDGDLEGVR